MRRKDRELQYEEAYEVFERAEYATLSLVDGDKPYAIPISFVIKDNEVYFHSAMEGSKITIIQKNKNAVLSVVGRTKPIYNNKQFTTFYESGIAYGDISFVKDDNEKILALRLLCEKYLPNDMDKFDQAIEMSLARTEIFKLNIATLTGKHKGTF